MIYEWRPWQNKLMKFRQRHRRDTWDSKKLNKDSVQEYSDHQRDLMWLDLFRATLKRELTIRLPVSVKITPYLIWGGHRAQ